MRTSHRTLASCAFRKRVQSSASAADAATNLRIVQVMWMAPLMIIGESSRGMLPRKKVATGAAAGVGCAKVGSIGMYVEDHVRSSVANFSIRMRGPVIKELGDRITCLFSGCFVGRQWPIAP